MKPTPRGKSLRPGNGVAVRRRARTRSLTHLEFLRMRIAAAEATWREAKEQADQAKRRRKLARLLAKRAKKDAKAARAHLDELRQALGEATGKSAMLRRQAVARKPKVATSAGAKSLRTVSRKKRTLPRRKAAPSTPESAILAIVQAEKALLGTPPGQASSTS